MVCTSAWEMGAKREEFTLKFIIIIIIIIINRMDLSQSIILILISTDSCITGFCVPAQCLSKIVKEPNKKPVVLRYASHLWWNCLRRGKISHDTGFFVGEILIRFHCVPNAMETPFLLQCKSKLDKGEENIKQEMFLCLTALGWIPKESFPSLYYVIPSQLCSDLP